MTFAVTSNKESFPQECAGMANMQAKIAILTKGVDFFLPIILSNSLKERFLIERKSSLIPERSVELQIASYLFDTSV